MLGEISRRAFLEILGIGSLRPGFDSSSLEKRVTETVQSMQPARRTIGKFNDGYKNLEIIDMYSDGMLLRQSIDLIGTEYSAEVMYFIRNGHNKEFSMWSVACFLYKKSTMARVNFMFVDGSAESGKFVVTNMTEPDSKNLVEATLTSGTYEQSSMRMLERMDEKEINQYFNYFGYVLKPFRESPLKPIPPNYNPFQVNFVQSFYTKPTPKVIKK